MIRAIVAIDINQGLANDQGIPWNLPNDKAYFRSHTEGSTIIMGQGFYNELNAPLPNRRNVVASTNLESVKPGFELTHNARDYLRNFQGDIWIAGGALLYESTLDLAEELFVTQINEDFGCTKFFPVFKDLFVLSDESETQKENDITFRFQVWKRKK